jgi:hypothetical protein
MGLDHFTPGDIAHDDPPVERRAHRHIRLDRVFAIQPVDFLPGNTQQFETVLCFARFGSRGFHFRFAPLQLGQTHGLVFVQISGSLVGEFGFVQLGHGFEVGTFRHAEVRAVEHRQERIFLDVLADVHMDFHDTAPDQGRNFGQFVLVGLNRGGELAMREKLPLRRRYGFECNPCGFLGRQPQESAL